jgi:TatD DNase family protein
MLTDSHCHLASHRFDPAEVPDLLERARQAGVDRVVTLVTGLDDLQANLDIAGTHPQVHCCIGIHPCHVHEAPDDAVERLSRFTSDPRVCALGETGLDYFHPAPEGWAEEDFRARQRAFLRRHFELAAATGLNVVIHTRDRSGDASLRDALTIHQQFRGRARALFHCFVASAEALQATIEAAGVVSFGGVITFKNAAEVLATAVACPAGAFLLETDAPYLAPVPHRGQRNEPCYVRHTAERLAGARGETLSELARHTNAAADAFFRFASRPHA